MSESGRVKVVLVAEELLSILEALGRRPQIHKRRSVPLHHLGDARIPIRDQPAEDMVLNPLVSGYAGQVGDVCDENPGPGGRHFANDAIQVPEVLIAWDTGVEVVDGEPHRDEVGGCRSCRWKLRSNGLLGRASRNTEAEESRPSGQTLVYEGRPPFSLWIVGSYSHGVRRSNCNIGKGLGALVAAHSGPRGGVGLEGRWSQKE